MKTSAMKRRFQEHNPKSAPDRESYVILFAPRNHGRDCNRVVTRGKAIRFTVPRSSRKSLQAIARLIRIRRR
ncbi:Uncharacterized protein DBV15_01655, partial [Temnothorax longispinosus]